MMSAEDSCFLGGKKPNVLRLVHSIPLYTLTSAWCVRMCVCECLGVCVSEYVDVCDVM